MQIPTWFEFIKPRLSKETIGRATATYFETYYPEIHAEALTLPHEANMPDDLNAGAQLVASLFEERLLG